MSFDVNGHYLERFFLYLVRLFRFSIENLGQGQQNDDQTVELHIVEYLISEITRPFILP